MQEKTGRGEKKKDFNLRIVNERGGLESTPDSQENRLISVTEG